MAHCVGKWGKTIRYVIGVATWCKHENCDIKNPQGKINKDGNTLKVVLYWQINV
jgi:hypothetical protein